MPVHVSLLRAVNVGGRSPIRMHALAELYRAQGLDKVTTVLQSGNVVFSTRPKDASRIAGRLETAIAEAFGIRTRVILRAADEFRTVIAANPFADRPDISPSRLVVLFLAGTPAGTAASDLAAVCHGPEEIRVSGREVYIHYAGGIARSKLTSAVLDRVLGQPGTARNWNTVTRLMDVANRIGS